MVQVGPSLDKMVQVGPSLDKMVQVGPSLDKISPYFTHFYTPAIQLKQCKSSKIRFLFNYIFINIIFLPNSK